MTGQPKSAQLQALYQDKRMDPAHRQRIDAAIHMQGRGWITGRVGGRPGPCHAPTACCRAWPR